MKTYDSEGKNVTLTVPTGGVVKDTAYLIGALVVIATATVADATPSPQFVGLAVGVVQVVKATGTAWTEGARIYWDNVAKKFTSVLTSNVLVGVAVDAAASGDTVGFVRLDGVAR